MRRDDAEPVFARIVHLRNSGHVVQRTGHRRLRASRLALVAAPAFQGAAALVPVIVAAYCVKGIGDFLRCLFLAEAGRLRCRLQLVGRRGVPWGIPAPDSEVRRLGSRVRPLSPRSSRRYRLRGMDVPLRPYRVETGRLAKICRASAAAAGACALFHLLPAWTDRSGGAHPGFVSPGPVDSALPDHRRTATWLEGAPLAGAVERGWEEGSELKHLKKTGAAGPRTQGLR